MPKLATPVQYEPSLEGLNAIRPLQLAEESKVIIPHSVLCKNPPSADRPAVGMLARCSEQGALLKYKNTWANNVSYKVMYLIEALPIGSSTFFRRVYGVVARFDLRAGVGSVWWCDSIGRYTYTQLATDYWKFLPFVGKTISFLGDGFLGWDCKVYFYGFYK